MDDEDEALSNHKRSVVAAVTAIREAVQPYTFRLFMRTVDFGIEQLLDKPQSGGLNTS
jgi:hypothetical protein